MTTTSENTVVLALGESLCRRIGQPRYQLWFQDKTKFIFREDALVVGVPNHFYQEWLQNTFADEVREASREVLGQPLAVQFSIDAELFQAARRRESGAEAGPVQAGSPAPAHVPGAGASCGEKVEDRPAPPVRGPLVRGRTSNRRWHQLADFVVGPCNRVAHASALSLVESPGEGPNPLVIHGPVGTGKTHLLEGVYSGLHRTHPEWRLCLATAEDFTNRFLQAMRQGKLPVFRKQFRECDALLVDDLHFLGNKPATQEEFLHTLNVLQAEDRPVVVSCDCHPRLSEDFMPELTDRLLGGAVWGLGLPEAGTRLEVLRAKVGRGSMPVPEGVLQYLAEQLRGNVRELAGALHSLRHFSRVVERPIDLDLAREVVADLQRTCIRVVQLADIDRAVRGVLGLDAGDLQSKKRDWRFSHPRMLAMYLARKHTGASYTEIGHWFGGRNHSTTVAAEKKVRRWLQEDSCLNLGQRRLRLRDLVERVERDLHQ